MTSSADLDPDGYSEFLAELKARVRATQVRAARAANTQVLRLYWSVGRDILDRQEKAGWGSKVVTRLAADLGREFPEQRGWSRTNLLYMRKTAEVWPTETEFVHHVGGRLPWRHITVLLDRLDTRAARDWYADQAAENGWTRAALEHHIKAGLRASLGAAPTNFTTALDSPDSELAQQLVKDPYVFEHLGLVNRLSERDVEQALMDRLQDTLLELGRGMAFIGRQVRLTVVDEYGPGTDEFYVDLLFFHVEQLRYVVVELKIGRFEPAHLGQLGTYVAIVDDQYRRKEIHAPTVGILLCTGKNGSTVRYSLASASAPIAVADLAGLPPDAQASLPTSKELNAIVKAELEEHTARDTKSPSGFTRSQDPPRKEPKTTRASRPKYAIPTATARSAPKAANTGTADAARLGSVDDSSRSTACGDRKVVGMLAASAAERRP